MNKNEYVNILQNPSEITKEQIGFINSLIKDFPFFQSSRAIYLKVLKNTENFKYNQELKLTAAYTTDRSILFDFITSNEFQQEKIVFNKNELKNAKLSNTKKEKTKDEIVEFQKNDMHTFSEWLTLSKLKPIDRNSNKKKEDENYDLEVVYEDNHNDLMTEALAKLYLSQKNYKKAIQSYKILSLKFPEKSSYFADQIKKIKKSN